MIRNLRTITWSAFLAMFFLGVANSLVGAAAASIGLAPSQIGFLIAAMNLGFMVGVMVAGALADTHDKARILLAGSLILAVAFLAFYVTDSFGVNLVVMFVVGVGMGAFEGVTDALLLDIHKARQNYYINVNHFFVTFGSIIIAVYFLFLTLNWRLALEASAAIVLLLAVVFALTRLPHVEHHPEPYLNRLRILARDRIVLTLFVSAVLVVGVEAGTVGIMTSFLSGMRGLAAFQAQWGLVLFLVGVGVGRLLVGYFSRDEQVATLLIMLFGFSTVIYAALYFVNLGPLVYGLIFLAGLGMSALIPLMLTLAGLPYPDMAGTVLGAIKVAFPVGGIILPFLMSVLAARVSFGASIALFPLAFLFGFLLLWTTLRGVRVAAPEPAA